MRKIKAVTLQELLVALIIIGILMLISIPILMPLISKTRSTEAQYQLGYIHTLEKNHFYMYSRYTTDFEELGYEHVVLVSEGGNGNYIIEITEASVNEFKAKATAIVDFDGDGVFNVWEIDQDNKLREVVKD